MNKFEEFLNRLKTDRNKSLIETIQKGFQAINESYADVREEKVSALVQFNEHAAMTASAMGNSVLNFLQRSSEGYSHLYKEDTEPELDGNPTSEFNQYRVPIKPRDEIEDSLGLTAGELAEFANSID